MDTQFDAEILNALPGDAPTNVSVTHIGHANLPSCFDVSGLASASILAASRELAACIGARSVTLDHRLASMWFDMTIRPIGWDMPGAWDAIAGAYQTADGWIRLHTNAPHHRDAAIQVLGCGADKPSVATAVAAWKKTSLEEAIVAAGGAAAAMHGMDVWANHPQGRAVAAEPLIAWEETGAHATPADVQGLKVLDLTRVLAGPVATRFLAGFGADVLRIDPPWWSEPAVEPEVTLGKTRAGLDLTQQDDRRVFESLLRQADVLVHGYRADAMAGLGYDDARLRALAPQMINVRLNAYGWTGPWRNRRGFDSLVQMSCGIADEGMRRAQSDHPIPLPVQALDHATGYLIATAVLRALRIRNQTGRVMAAKLSLARTAAMLVSTGPRGFEGTVIKETSADLSPAIEHTGWGPAHRLRFPVHIDGAAPSWPHPAGPLRESPAQWRAQPQISSILRGFLFQ